MGSFLPLSSLEPNATTASRSSGAGGGIKMTFNLSRNVIAMIWMDLDTAATLQELQTVMARHTDDL